MLLPPSLPRNQLLLEMARRSGGPGAPLAERHRAILEDREQREAFLHLVGRHYLHGLTLPRLAALEPAGGEIAAVRETARRSFRRMQAEARLWDLERDRLVQLLGEGGLRPMVLKGAALRLTAYSEPAHRPLGDLDLLVPRPEVPRASEILNGIGYRIPYSGDAVRALERQHFHLRFARDPFVVELHWELNSARGAYHLDPASFLGRSHTRTRTDRTDVRVPSPEDMVLHMVAQNLDSQVRLGRLVDIDRVIDAAGEFDWDYLGDAARAAGLLSMLSVDLRLCRTFLETPLPPGYVSRLHVSRINRWHLALMRPATWPFTPASERPAAHQLKRLWGGADHRGRLDWVRGILTDRRDPLHWVWDERAENARPPSFRRGFTVFAKLFAYQCWLYVRGAALLFTRSGRRELSILSE